MKYLSKLIYAAILITGFAACKKVADLPFYSNGTAVTLTSSVTTIAPTAADADETVLTLSWTNPKYATDSAHQKFIMEMDSTESFATSKTFEVTGPLSRSYTGKELNDMLANFGFVAGHPFKIYIRVISSYANNNERYYSNVINVTMTPYLVPITLTASSTADITLDVTHATENALSFNWNESDYGDNMINYALQIDTAGDNFATPQIIKYGTTLNSTLIQNVLNTAIINAGVLGGTTKNIEFRIVSYLDDTYTNPLVYSNAVTVNVTTYVPVPDNLYIVGDATPGGWNNPVPTPSQQFTKIDDYSFSITLGLTAGKSYLFLPLNGNWDHKYGGASAMGGTLLKDGDVPGSNTPAPATSGVYKIVVNFQTNTYTLTQITVPSHLYIVGDATDGGWNNPVPLPSQQFTQIDPVTFAIVLNLNAGKSYLFLPLNGNWDHKFGGATDGTESGGGLLKADGDVPGSNTPAPATTGLYKIVVNFATNSYTVTPYTGPDNLYIVGDATAGGWNNPVPLPTQQFTKVTPTEFKLTLPLISGKSYLFLPLNGNWDHKFGGSTDGTGTGGGTLLADGDVPGSNTPSPSTSGTYTIDVNFLTGKYTVTP